MWILYLEGKELVRNVFEGASGQWLDCRREEITQEVLKCAYRSCMVIGEDEWK